MFKRNKNGGTIDQIHVVWQVFLHLAICFVRIHGVRHEVRFERHVMRKSKTMNHRVVEKGPVLWKEKKIEMKINK